MDIFYTTESFWECLSNYVALKGKSMMYFKAVGIQNSTDDDKKQEAIDHYKKICPPEIVDSMLLKEHNILFFEDSYAARQKCEEWFPFIDEMGIPEYNVYVQIFNENGDSIFENLPFLKDD